MYSSHDVITVKSVIYMLVVLYVIGALPFFTAIKLKHRGLMVVSAVCGLASFFVVPPMISAALVARHMPESLPGNEPHRGIERAFLAGYLALSMLLPMLSTGFGAYNGYQLLVNMLNSYGSGMQPVLFILFALAAIAYIICSFSVGDRALYGFRTMTLILGSMGVALFINTPGMMIAAFGYSMRIGYIFMPLMMTVAVIYAWYATVKLFSGRTERSVGMDAPGLGRDIIKGWFSSIARTFAGSKGWKDGFEPPPGPTKTAFCPMCGSPVKPEQRFCGKCGHPLKARR